MPLAAPGVAVENAALPDPGEILDTTVGRLRTAYDVDVLGAVVAAQVAAPVLRTAGTGTLLFTSGGFADHPVPALASLSIGKAVLSRPADPPRACPRARSRLTKAVRRSPRQLAPRSTRPQLGTTPMHEHDAPISCSHRSGPQSHAGRSVSSTASATLTEQGEVARMHLPL
ncbi:MAG TPA: hypothetical protein VFI54_06525 [Solirubrobacteraceae bacterium]|nr:hypothetical protein [Solirubrobacteraceae bacterium]